MRRIVFAAALLSFLVAGSAMAVVSPASIDGSKPPSVPEPTAALLFAAGLGVSAWALRRRSDRS